MKKAFAGTTLQLRGHVHWEREFRITESQDMKDLLEVIWSISCLLLRTIFKPYFKNNTARPNEKCHIYTCATQFFPSHLNWGCRLKCLKSKTGNRKGLGFDSGKLEKVHIWCKGASCYQPSASTVNKSTGYQILGLTRKIGNLIFFFFCLF